MQSALTEETSRAIHKILDTLLEKVEAEAVFLCDGGGNILAENSIEAYGNIENIGALAAGSFFATLELAKLVGEPKFRSMNQQGENSSIYMEGLTEDLLLVIIFGPDSNVGLVKLYAKYVGRELAKFNVAIDQSSPEHQEHIHSIKLEIDETVQPFVRSGND